MELLYCYSLAITDHNNIENAMLFNEEIASIGTNWQIDRARLCIIRHQVVDSNFQIANTTLHIDKKCVERLTAKLENEVMKSFRSQLILSEVLSSEILLSYFKQIGLLLSKIIHMPLGVVDRDETSWKVFVELLQEFEQIAKSCDRLRLSLDDRYDEIQLILASTYEAPVSPGLIERDCLLADSLVEEETSENQQPANLLVTNSQPQPLLHNLEEMENIPPPISNQNPVEHGPELILHEPIAPPLEQEQANPQLEIQLGFRQFCYCLGYIIIFYTSIILIPLALGKLIEWKFALVGTLTEVFRKEVVNIVENEANLSFFARSFSNELADLVLSSSGEEEARILDILMAKARIGIEIVLGLLVMVSLVVLALSAIFIKYLVFSSLPNPANRRSFYSLVVEGFYTAVEGAHFAIKLLLSLALYMIFLPTISTVLIMKVMSSTDRSITMGFTKGSDAPFAILFFMACYGLSLLAIAHILFVAGELRLLLKPIYLKELLPKENLFDQAVLALNRVERNEENPENMARSTWIQRLYSSISKATFSSILKKFSLRCCLVLPGILFMVIIPLKLGHIFSLTFQPFSFKLRGSGMTQSTTMGEGVTSPSSFNLSSIPIEMVISHILLPILIERMQYAQTVRAILKGLLLQTKDLFNTDSILSDTLMEESAPPRTIATSNNEVKLTLILTTILFSFSLLSSWLLHVPLFVGRKVLGMSKFQDSDDIFCYPVGGLICYLGYYMLNFIILDFRRYLIDPIRNQSHFVTVALAILKWVTLAFQVAVASTVWLVVPPLLIGYLLEAGVILPFRTDLQSTPSFPFLQSWAIGLILLKLFVK